MPPRKKFHEVDPWEVMGLMATEETDRGAILAAAEFLSLALEELLSARVVAHGTENGNQRDGSAAFLQRNSDLQPRIHAAWALGLLRPAEYANLKRIAAMRNEVAHTPGRVGFFTRSIGDLCAALTWPPGDRSPELDGRMRFFTVAKYILVTLFERVGGVRRAMPWRPPIFPDIPPPPPLPPGVVVAGPPLVDEVFENDESKRET